MCTCFNRFKFYISYRSLSAVVAMTSSYLKETAYHHGHCKWCMAKESTKLPISGQFDNDVQMVPKTKTDVVDHVCCLLCFIHGPGLIVQCHSQNKLKRSWGINKLHIAALGYHQAVVAFVCSSTRRLTSLKRSIF